jgi:hypothetical protein
VSAGKPSNSIVLSALLTTDFDVRRCGRGFTLVYPVGLQEEIGEKSASGFYKLLLVEELIHQRLKQENSS